MNTSPIGNLVEKTRQIDPVKLEREFITYIDIASIDRETKRIIQAQIIRASEAPSRARKQIQTNDVLVSTVRPNLNAVTRVASHYDNEIASTGFCVLRPDKNLLESRYLFFFVQTDNFISRLTRMATGAGYPAVSDDDILDCEIPLPPLLEQQRIAAILDRADRLRRTRRYAAQLSESFLQAVFVRMFGEPIQNPRQWKKLMLEELGKVTTGSTPPSVNEGMFGGTIPFVTPGDLEVNTEQAHRFVTEQGAEQSRTVRAGSTLVCSIGATIGKMDKARVRCAFNQQINAVEWDTRINDDFALIMMRFYTDYIAARGKSTTLPILKKSEFEEIAVPVPPLALQEKFARIVQQYERLRVQQREAERQAEHLFQTLLHRAFV